MRAKSAAWGAALLLCLLLAGPVRAFNQSADDQNPQVRLRWLALPIAYRINPATGGNVTQDGGAAIEAVREAFQAWQAVPTATVSFRDDGVTSLASSSRSDGFNAVSFVDSSFPYSGALAVTPYTYDTASGAIIHANVLFNPAERFSTGGAPGTFDVQAIATHEIGHLIGLDHSAVIASSMLPFACRDCAESRTLSLDDIAGVSNVYPIPGFLTVNGTVQGRIVRHSTGLGVFGAHVIVTLADGRLAAGAYTSRDGSYSISGLTPGRYSVLVEALDGPVDTSQLSSPYLAFNAASLESDFATAEFQEGLPFEVFSGQTRSGVDVIVGAPASSLNLYRIGAGTGSVEPSGCVTVVPAGSAGHELVVAGAGLADTDTVRVSGGEIALELLEAFSLADGMRAHRYRIDVPAATPLGERTVRVSRPGALSVLAGALEVTAPVQDTRGPRLTVSYDRDPTAVGPGPLTIRLLSNEPLATAPLLSVDRPGSANDLLRAPMTQDGSSRQWRLGYQVSPADGASVLDGVCVVSVDRAEDAAGNAHESLEADRFTVDTGAPGGLLSYSSRGTVVGPGILSITASFSEPLARPPRIAIDRPGQGNDVAPTAMQSLAEPSVFTFFYDVARASPPSVLDGPTVVTLDGIADAAGNSGTPVANNVFQVDTVTASVTLGVDSSRSVFSVGALALVLESTKPLAAAPRITVDRPGAGNDARDQAMGDAGGATRWTYEYVVLRRNGNTIQDGLAVASVGVMQDLAGNAVTPPPAVALPIDTRPPVAVFELSRPALAIPSGPLTVTASFDEPLALTPSLSIERPGEAHDLPMKPMEATTDPARWTARYDVARQNGLEVQDGPAPILLLGAVDAAGNEALVSAGGVVVFATAPTPPIAVLSFGAAPISRVPAGPLRVTASFNVELAVPPPWIARFPPSGESPAPPDAFAATADPLVFIADVEVPSADGETRFDGVHTLQVFLSDGSPVRTLNDRFRSRTFDSLGRRHEIFTVPAGLSVLSLALDPGETAPFRASGLATLLGAQMVVGSEIRPSDGRSIFRTHVPGLASTDFDIAGNRAYVVSLPAARTVGVSGTDWPDTEQNLTVGRGCNLVSLPLGCPSGYSARKLAEDSGGGIVARPRRAGPGGRLVFEPFTEGCDTPFALDLEEAFVLLLPERASVILPKAQ